jgi:hypothetical protein
MAKTPDILPDDMALKIADLAISHGYGVEDLTLAWRTKGLGYPPKARVEYSVSDRPDVSTLDSPWSPSLSRSPTSIDTESAPPKSK